MVCYYLQNANLWATVEDTDVARIKKDLKQITGAGEISVKVCRMGNGTIVPIPNKSRHISNTVTEIVEKADKGRGLTHGIA